ncbi:MAG: NERD domain-containing protein [Actinomycetota bacterium]|nr:NERD domain-containing protein [Actinomycetota bacterium]
MLGRVVTAFTAKPVVGRQSQATRAWADGALGEEHVARVLARCSGVRTVHDCRMSGSRANIDHIAIGPSGVFVIDAKRYSGLVERRDVGGWLRSDERLYVARRDRTKLVDGLQRQVEAVRRALQDQEGEVVPVTPVLCFVGAEWPMLRRTRRVRGVIVTWPMALAKLVTAPGALTADDTARLATSVAAGLPDAYGRRSVPLPAFWDRRSPAGARVYGAPGASRSDAAPHLHPDQR